MSSPSAGPASADRRGSFSVPRRSAGSQTRRTPVSMTTSPSSLVKGVSAGAGRISSTASDGRHSLTPRGVTTMGRLMRMGVREHEADQLFVRPLRVGELEDTIGRPLFPDDRTHGQLHCGNEFVQPLPRRWCLEVLDDLGLDAGVPDDGERVARRAALRVVIDRDLGHVCSLKPWELLGHDRGLGR